MKKFYIKDEDRYFYTFNILSDRIYAYVERKGWLFSCEEMDHKGFYVKEYGSLLETVAAAHSWAIKYIEIITQGERNQREMERLAMDKDLPMEIISKLGRFGK